MTEINWTPLSSIEQLNELNAQSEKFPVVIFKHSTRCSISAASLNRLERKWEEARAGGVKPYFLDLIANREVSTEVAQRYGVEHQSPQLLLIQNGRCVYDTSHFGISFEDILDHIKSVPVR